MSLLDTIVCLRLLLRRAREALENYVPLQAHRNLIAEIDGMLEFLDDEED